MVLAVLVVWRIIIAPEQVLMPWNAFVVKAVPRVGYLRDFAAFPFQCAVLLLPWTLLAWPGFCLAYRPMEKDQGFFHFLRALVFAPFIAAWVLPKVEPTALLPVVGPLAVLTGMHYGILVRRHYRELRVLWQAMVWLAIAVGGAAVVLGLMFMADLVVLAGFDDLTYVISMVMLTVVVVAARYLRAADARQPFWWRFVVATGLLRLVWAATWVPGDSWASSGNRYAGAQLGANVPPSAIVYKTASPLLVAECFYLDRNVVGVANLEEDLPTDERTVFVLAGARPPILPTRTWEPWSEPVQVTRSLRARFVWRPSRFCLVRVEPELAGVETGSPAMTVRMYKGELRQ